MLANLYETIVAFKGAGEMASGIAWRLHRAGIRRIYMLEIDQPLAVRRRVSFCEAVYQGRVEVEDVTAVAATSIQTLVKAWDKHEIPVLVDPQWQILPKMPPAVLVDAILAKRNLGTHMGEAGLTIGLGPGFQAGKDVHLVVETKRGHNLGRIITTGKAAANTGEPGDIDGQTKKRVLRATTSGHFNARCRLGDFVGAGQVIGHVVDVAVAAQIDGIVRGLIHSGIAVSRGLKLGDIDPRGLESYVDTISDKARALGGSVLEAILTHLKP
jgi:xanthine dehydrogenase accessory factor